MADNDDLTSPGDPKSKSAAEKGGANQEAAVDKEGKNQEAAADKDGKNQEAAADKAPKGLVAALPKWLRTALEKATILVKDDNKSPKKDKPKEDKSKESTLKPEGPIDKFLRSNKFIRSSPLLTRSLIGTDRADRLDKEHAEREKNNKKPDKDSKIKAGSDKAGKDQTEKGQVQPGGKTKLPFMERLSHKKNRGRLIRSAVLITLGAALIAFVPPLGGIILAAGVVDAAITLRPGREYRPSRNNNISAPPAAAPTNEKPKNLPTLEQKLDQALGAPRSDDNTKRIQKLHEQLENASKGLKSGAPSNVEKTSNSKNVSPDSSAKPETRPRSKTTTR